MFEDGDPRIDRAYTVFYLFINIGSTLSAGISEIAERSDNFSIGFAFSTVGMLLGLIIFILGNKHYKGSERIGSKPALYQKNFGVCNKIWIALGFIVLLPVIIFFFTTPAVTNYFMLIVSVTVIGIIIWQWKRHESKRERGGIIAILVYVIYQIAYFSLYQQVSDTIILFMDRVVDMQIVGVSISSGAASLLFNSVFVIVLAPLLAYLYSWLGNLNWEPSTPVKFFLALVVMSLSFLIFGLAAQGAISGTKASIWLVILGFFIFTISDVLSGPISLSLIAQLSPKGISGFMMGAMFFSMAAGGYVSGLLTAWVSSDDGGMGSVEKYAAVYSQLFMYCAGAMLVVALLYLLVVPFLKRVHYLVSSEADSK